MNKDVVILHVTVKLLINRTKNSTSTNYKNTPIPIEYVFICCAIPVEYSYYGSPTTRQTPNLRPE